MAFALVAVSNHAGDLTTSITITKPTGTAQNDIMFAWIKHNANEEASSVPTGWTEIGDNWNAVSSSRWFLFWKLAGGSEPADYQWTFATSARITGSIVSYRDGFDTADPIDVVSNTAYTTSNTTVRAAGMTVAAANSPLIFFGMAHSSAAQTYTPPTNPTTFAEDTDFWGSGGGRGSIEIASVVWSGSGATGDIDATLSASSTGKHAFAVALNPASANWALAVTKADLQPTGQTITLNQTWSTVVTKADLQPSASSLVLNQSAVLTQADLQPTGQDITLTWVNPWTIAVDKADLQPAGQSIALNQSWSIAVDKADLQPAGQDITLNWTQTGLVAVDSAAFTIDGQTIAFDLSSVVDVASPSISGSVVDLVLTAGTTEQPSGGWVESAYERRYAQINDEIRRELEAEKEREELAERLERVLVQEGTLTQAQADLIRLRGIAAKYSRDDLPNRARRALAFAERAQSEFSTRLALREIRRLEEEEEMAVLLLMTLD